MTELHILAEGYATPGPAGLRVGSSIGYVRDGDQHVVIDPGLVAHPASIVAALAEHGCRPEDVTDVVISHHHPDHTMNVGLFADARVHDHWAVYHRDTVVFRPGHGVQVSPAVSLLAVPGHTAQDLATVVRADAATTVFTHLWATALEEEPFGDDPAAMRLHRAEVLTIADVVVPGHGSPFSADGFPRSS